jgi:hypothetical protein
VAVIEEDIKNMNVAVEIVAVEIVVMEITANALAGQTRIAVLS